MRLTDQQFERLKIARIKIRMALKYLDGIGPARAIDSLLAAERQVDRKIEVEGA